MPDLITPSTLIMSAFCVAVFAIVLIGERVEKKVKSNKRGASRV